MTTASEEKEEKEGGEEVLLAFPQGKGRTCATSLTLPRWTSLDAVTERVRRSGRSAGRAVALLDKPGSLVHAQPPTFRQAHDRHRECAAHIRLWTPLRAGRYTWGYLHLLVILPPLYLAAWVTESPLRLAVTAALIAAVWHWS